ncbi:hypothetical protein [Dysgonomonas sp. ZJ279]|uniref:hypothetical protein n=1 Tax=Dysgonomonas sp. ZJ279 TaxID=2709796 RepID=UPI0013EAE1D3|nr:hypothetical protein [Dysgonomonas sp. ZJ279]
MKRIKKIKLEEVLLSQEELKQLRGGDMNKNIASGCNCKFYNGPSLTNYNSVEGCACTCVY